MKINPLNPLINQAQSPTNKIPQSNNIHNSPSWQCGVFVYKISAPDAGLFPCNEVRSEQVRLFV